MTKPKAEKYVFAKPDRPNWQEAVERAAKLLREQEKVDFVNQCQNVPLKYLAQLEAEARALNR